MKTFHILLLLPMFILSQLPIKAQQTAFFEDVQNNRGIAKELFEHGKYNAAYREFEKIEGKVDEKSELFSEAEYFKSVSALKAGHTVGSKMVSNFLKNYPESPYKNIAWFNLGDYQFGKKQYRLAIRSFSNVDRTDLSADNKIQLIYQNGYSELMEENLEKAATEFYQIKDKNNLYSKPATYYWAHIMYVQENYESALQGFSKLNGDPTYSKVIPIYVSHIYYKQQKYDEVVSYTVSILNDVEKEHQPELSKIIGDSYFHLNDYVSAVSYLETYYNTPGLKTREDSYILGFCYYHTGNYKKAAPLLEKASKGNDEMAQNAFYHLADTYIRLNDKEKARVAFEAASEFDFNDRIKEDALFSFAKLTYELSYSPFNETIKAFDRYISLYPNSERNAEAYRILVEVYMVTKNYADAISSIEKIEVKTPEILRAYQRVTFYRGLELFNNLAYNQAINFYDLSLKNGSYDRTLKAKALYWKAEALYRVGDYNNSITVYNQFLGTAGAFSLPEYSNAQYNLAYAYFKLGDYESASSLFRKYINAMQGKRTERLADAFNRVGDYYFFKTNYTIARENYRQAYNLKTFDSDYALFQIAFCQGLQHDQKGKINSLERLLAGFPDSDFQDDALYELGRANERMGKSYIAAQQYQKIVENYPEGNYYRKSLLQMGLINYNNGDFAKALVQYKKVAENYQGTPEARAALPGIKNCYIEMNNIDGYFAYTKQLGAGANVTISEQDSLTYLAAERTYMAGKPGASAQLSRYLQQFPYGSFALNAHFYLAELLYKEARYSDANEHYSFVAMQPDNIFSEPALSRSSELTFNAEQYSEALEMFNRLGKIANSKWNILKAQTGQMRCNFKLKNYSQAIAAAAKVKSSAIANEALTNDANYTIGKSYYEMGNLGKAFPSLKEVAADTKLKQGAEAKYLVALIYYNQNKKPAAEKEIMDFINKGTPYQFWLGKAFLLLSDIYLDKGDEFQAKHTLKSVVENYGNSTDGIKAEATKKLTAIEAGEKMEQKKAIDNSLQLKLNESKKQ
ncbi:MAG: tetratricopeptide repeat protein [Prolixibacteraceae bacterium]|nr:tetratricopeptide repeat protein [Prolixibacteraceae bacterium]